MTAKNSLKGALLCAAAGTMLLAGTGIASAAGTIGTGAAVTAVPSVAWQVCGNAFVGNDNHVGGVSTGAKPVVGVKITGTLVGGSAPWTDSTTTDAAGRWCLAGTKAMGDDVKGGATVNLVSDTPTVSDASGTYSGKWSNGGGDANIDALEFLFHGNSGITSDRASKVNFIYKLV